MEIPKKKDLEILFSTLIDNPSPKLDLEQYPLSPQVAAQVLHTACVFNDITGKIVLDLGTGNGVLAIGADLLGAKESIGLDIDRESLRTAVLNAQTSKCHVEWVLGDIETMRGLVDTVLMNPPFGARQIHSDMRFLSVALKLAPVIYTIHKSSTRQFILSYLQRTSSRPGLVIPTRLRIKHMFPFHRKKKYEVDVDIYRIERKKAS